MREPGVWRDLGFRTAGGAWRPKSLCWMRRQRGKERGDGVEDLTDGLSRVPEQRALGVATDMVDLGQGHLISGGGADL